ncbi:MAG: hypothetical protein ABN482_06185 [Corticimicrobacter sp.]|uniref:hypothetical protein n=1 Tax=Corticimicrobacter sp. TaxID=2678536 RepID=UPI0032DAD324
MVTILALLASLVTPAADLPCTYLSKSQQELHQVQACASLENGQPVLNAGVLADLQFDGAEGGLAQVHVNRRWHWVRPDGHMQEVLTFDNGADPFSEGLTRGPGTKGVAYYDRSLQRILDLPYAWGMPFQDGRALVCADCVESTGADEHRALVGDTWGVIDRAGKEVLAPGLSLQEAVSRRDLLP